jgi:hypothetical protein
MAFPYLECSFFTLHHSEPSMKAAAFPYLVISDANYKQFLGTKPSERSGLVASTEQILNPILRGPTGYKGWHHPEAKHNFRGSRPVGATISRDQWVPRIQAGQGSFLSDLVKQRGMPAKDQGDLGYCWVYGSTRSMEIQRVAQGLPMLDLSPESVGGPLTRWRNEGGYASEAFGQLENYGACQSSFMDAPHSLTPRRWKAGWQQDALQHEVTDWYELDASDKAPIFAAVITCLLNRVPVAAGLDWWGHLVCFLDPIVLPDGTVGVLFMNSWGVDWPTPGANGLACLTEDRATPDGAAAPVISGLPRWS